MTVTKKGVMGGEVRAIDIDCLALFLFRPCYIVMGGVFFMYIYMHRVSVVLKHYDSITIGVYPNIQRNIMHYARSWCQ